MSEQQLPEAPQEASAHRRAAAVMEKLIGAADVAKVYGEPIRHGDTLLIPAAEVVAVAGFGIGSGSGVTGRVDGKPTRGGGGGGGGGGRAMARSVAMIVAAPDGIRVAPIVDVSKIALAALTAAGFVWASWKGIARPKRWLA